MIEQVARLTGRKLMAIAVSERSGTAAGHGFGP